MMALAPLEIPLCKAGELSIVSAFVAFSLSW